MITTQQKEQLRELANQHGLAPLAERLVDFARPCVALSACGVDAYTQVGNCRLGGVPDVPPMFSWPEGMAFLMQLNMAAVGPLDLSGVLPKSGMVYFFLGNDESCGDLPHRVIYVDEPATKLQRAIPPSGYNSFESPDYEGGDTNVVYNPLELQAVTSISLPDYESRQYTLLRDELDKDQRSRGYFALREALTLPRSSRRVGQHQLLGYCSCIGDDADVVACFTRSNLDPDFYRYDKSDLSKLINEMEAELKKGLRNPNLVNYHKSLLKKRRAQLEFLETGADQIAEARKSVDDWVTLLDLDSDLNAGMCFWDAGRIHFMIHKDDFAHRRFDCTYSELITS